jgi:hypothetical protein
MSPLSSAIYTTPLATAGLPSTESGVVNVQDEMAAGCVAVVVGADVDANADAADATAGADADAAAGADVLDGGLARADVAGGADADGAADGRKRPQFFRETRSRRLLWRRPAPVPSCYPTPPDLPADVIQIVAE